MFIRSLFPTLLVAIFVSTTVSQKCPDGLTTNDVAINSNVDLEGKVALVTGGRSGLGKAISEALLHVGCKVVIASRNEDENEKTVEELKGNVEGADVSYMTFNLESFDNVRTFASSFIRKHVRLDYYFANAGQSESPYYSPEGNGFQPLTVDGYERIFQVNYISQVLLLDLLLPLLRESESGRAILTASGTHGLACANLGFNLDCFNNYDAATTNLPFNQEDWVGTGGPCSPDRAYSASKYLMIQLASEVAKREQSLGSQVSVYSWAPGNILTMLNPFAYWPYGTTPTATYPCTFDYRFVGLEGKDPSEFNITQDSFFVTPAHGAKAAVYSALVADTVDSGKYFPTYYQCEADEGRFTHGITSDGQSRLYDEAQTWYKKMTKSQKKDKKSSKARKAK